MSTPTARLEVVAGKAVGMSILVRDEIVIGRHADGAGRLADDEEISRTHARLTLEANGVCEIEDLGSTNGTFVNGLRISAPEALSVGDTIEVGQTTLAVRELPATRSPSSDKLFFPEEELEEEMPSPAAEELEEMPMPSPAAEAEEDVPAHVGEEEEEEEERHPAPPAPGPIPVPVPAPVPAAAEFQQHEPETPEPPAVAPEPVTAIEPTSSEAAETEPPPRLNVQLEVDFVNREARMALDGNSDPVRFVFEAGAWRLSPVAPDKEGNAQ